MGDNIAISDEANAALQEWMDARKNWNECGCEDRFRDAETTLNWMTQDPKHFRDTNDFNLKDFNALEDAYAMAYNDGHRDGRNRAGYTPSVVKIDRETFREAYKMRAESFEAQRQPPWSAANPMPNRIMECGECDAKGFIQGRECSKCDGAGFWKIMSPKCAICGDWIAGTDGAECDECDKWYCDAHYDIDNNSCVVCGDPMTDSESMLKHSEDPSSDWDPTGEERRLMGEKCEDERSFLISILSDRQLDEFMQFEEDSYSAETKLGKDSCCCGATKTNPCQCMVEGLTCSSTCPCSCGQKNAESRRWRYQDTGRKTQPRGRAQSGVRRNVFKGLFKKNAEEDCACPVCGTTTEVIREWYNDDTAYVDLVVCDNCYWMEELGENDEEYDAYMEQMLAMLDEEPDADLLEKPNVVVDTSWDWSDGVGPPSSQQTLDITFEAASQHTDIHTEPMMVPNPEYGQGKEVEYLMPDPSGKQVYFCLQCLTRSEGTPLTGPCPPPGRTPPPSKPTGTCPHCKEEVDHVGTAQVFYCPACHEDLGPSDMRGDDEPADWAKDVGLLEAEGDQFPSMHYGDYDSDAQEKYQEFVDEWDGDNDPPSFEEWYKGDEYHEAEGDELTDEEKQEVWNIFQEEASSLEDPNLEKIKNLADKYLTDVIDDETPEFFVDPGLEDYYQFILTDPTYPDGGEPEDEETAAMFEELKQVRYYATILTDRHIEEADNAAKAMIAAGIMAEDKKLFDQGMLGLETNNQVQRERELLAQWLAEGGVHGN